MPSKPTDFLEILRVLLAHEVEFIVVGGVCGTLHGSPLLTRDLDVVHRRSAENIENLSRALGALDARSRLHGRSDVAVGPSHLASPGHQLLTTRAGLLDLLGEIGNGLGYDDLIGHTVEMTARQGLVIRVLDLETLIRVKEESGREKDQAALPVLRRLLKERKKEG